MPNKLTDEQKARFKPMLKQTWEAIADDLMGQRFKRAEIVELTCDANRPQMFGGMSGEEYDTLCRAYDHPDTQKWLRSILNY